MVLSLYLKSSITDPQALGESMPLGLAWASETSKLNSSKTCSQIRLHRYQGQTS